MNCLDYLDVSSKERINHDLSADYFDRTSISYRVVKNCSIRGREIVTAHRGGTSRYIFIGFFMAIWGHCITDNLTKLWFIHTDDYKRMRNEGWKICCRKTTTDKLPENFIKLLRLFGLNIKEVEFAEETDVFGELIVPDDSVYIKGDYRFYHMEHKRLIERLASHIPVNPVSPKKIYLSRARLCQKYRDYGEKYIEETFRKMGFDIVYPEELSLEQQLELYRNCEVFAATEGSVSHNALFCKPGTQQVIVRKSQLYCSYTYYIRQLTDTSIIFIDSNLTYLEVDYPWSGPFLMCASNHLKDWAASCGVDITEEASFSDYIKYNFVCLAKLIKKHKVRKVKPFFLSLWKVIW